MAEPLILESLADADGTVREWARGHASRMPLSDEDGGICIQARTKVTGIPNAEATCWDDIDIEEMDAWIEANRPDFENAVVDLFAGAVQAIRESCAVDDTTLRLHRMMMLSYDPVEAVQAGKRDLGVHWSHVPYATAEDLARGYGFCENVPATTSDRELGLAEREIGTYLFTALVRVEDVLWTPVLFRNLGMFDFERELVVKDDAPIRLERITDVKGHTLGQGFDGMEFTSRSMENLNPRLEGIG